MDSDSEINWDEDEDLGDAEIPGFNFVPTSEKSIVHLFNSKSNINVCMTFKSQSNINVFLLLIVLLYKEDESESLNYPEHKLAL